MINAESQSTEELKKQSAATTTSAAAAIAPSPASTSAEAIAMDCGIAVGGVALALIARKLLDPWLGPEQPFSTFYIAIFFAAWFGGMVPAVLTLILGALAGDFFFVGQRLSLSIPNFNQGSGLLLYLVVGAAAILFAQANRNAQRRADSANMKSQRRQLALEREIAERRTAERSLQASEERFRRLADSNIVGIISYNADGRIEQANDEFLRMVGLIDNDTTAARARDALKTSTVTTRDFRINDTLSDGDVLAGEQLDRDGACPPYERELLHRDGKTRVPVLVGAARYGADRKNTIAFVLDQTQQHQARETLQMQSRVLESMVEGVVVTDASTNAIAYTNHSLDEMLGFSRNELIGADVRLLSALPVDEGSELDQEIDLALRVRGSWSGELRYFRRDESILVCDAMVSAMRSGERDYRIFVQQDASIRLAAEKAVAEAEDRLGLAMAAAAMGTWELDPATNQLMASSQIRALRNSDDATGSEPRDAIAMDDFFASLHPEDRPRVQAAVADALAGRKEYDEEFRGIREDGSIRWFSAQARVFRDENGTPLRMTGVTLDVTDRHDAETALRLSEERFRLAVEAVEAVIYDWDVQQNTTFRSAGLIKLLGFSATEVGNDGNWWPSRIHPDDFARATGEFNARLADPAEHSYESEYRIKHRDGHFVHVWDCGLIVRGADGRAVRVVGSALDITDRKTAEQHLRESEERFRQFADNTREVLWIHDARDGHLEYVSPAYDSIWGRSRDALLADQSSWIQTIHPDDREVATSAMAAAIAEGESSIKYRVIRPDGGVRWVHDRGFAIRDDQGATVRVAGIARDITEATRAADEIRRAKETAEAAGRAKDNFLAALSHELRTPLTPVLAVAKIMQSDSAISPTIREDLDMICRNIELEARLIDDLLDLTRVARGKIDLQMGLCDPDVAVRRAVEICAADAQNRGMQITLELNGGSCSVMADSARLQQVAWNLVKNAIKFTPAIDDNNPHGGHVIVRSNCANDGRDYYLDVIDDGIGIEPELVDRIFTAFEQGDPAMTRHFGGLGLGLTISKALADLHGGSLTVYSQGTGRGSTFTLHLPCSNPIAVESTDVQPPQLTDQIPDAATVDASDDQNGSAGHTTTSPAKRLHILLVEDHIDTARIVKRVLTRDGFDVTTAGSRGEALAIAAQQEFDLIISDIGLPDGSGLELMGQISASDRPIKGIALSGFGMDHDIERSKEAGFAEHLTKPIDVTRLEAVIRRVAGGAASVPVDNQPTSL